jgi:hypothetical protein
MALREFTDASGKAWTVWSTRPDWRSGVPAELHEGWLTFESGKTRKRLAPIPRGWEDASAARLQLYCSTAEEIPAARRSGPTNVIRGK